MDTSQPYSQFGNQDHKPSWTSALRKVGYDSCVTDMHKSHLTSQGSLLFSYCYMPHFCFALPLWMLCKILSSCQELSFRSSSKYTLTQPPVCPAQRSEEPPGLSLCFSSHCLGEARPSVPSLLPLGLPSLFEALLFWLLASPFPFKLNTSSYMAERPRKKMKAQTWNQFTLLQKSRKNT